VLKGNSELRLRVSGLALLLCAVTVNGRAASDDTPPWLTQVAAIKVPSYDKEVSAVVLVDDATVTVNEDGRVTEIYNFAVRILRRDGRGHAVARVGYIPATGKVKEFKAWLLRDNGTVKRYGKDDIVDIAADANDVYNEYRIKRLSAKDD